MPIRTPRHTTDPGWLRTAHPPTSACGHLPHLHPLLIAPTRQKRSIRTPRHAIEGGVDAVGVPQDAHIGSRGRVPHPDGIVPSATGQQRAIGTPGHVVERDRVALHDTHTLPTLHVPHP